MLTQKNTELLPHCSNTTEVMRCIISAFPPVSNLIFTSLFREGNANYNSGAPTREINPPAEHRVNIPPPGMTNSEVSSSYYSSGPQQTAKPPPHPTLALGFSKSNFQYDELAAATGGFGKDNLLGEGGFGYVYKGVLSNGKEIAVKSLKSGSCQGEREFQAEVEIISRVHHRHLVSLVGYCMADDKRMLVYEFVPNGTLEHHLHGKLLVLFSYHFTCNISLCTYF